MEQLGKLERMILGWIKDIPHLPVSARKWIADNVWWMAVIATILTGISVLALIGALFSNVSTLGSPIISYYASPAVVSWLIVTTAVALFFTVVQCLLLGTSVTPLKEKQKKGWVLLFAVWLVGVVSVVVGSVLTLNVLDFVGNFIFGAIGAAVSGYFIFEIHGQFAHVERSKGVKAKKVTK